jgi:type II secretory pathway component GspD/PulD (secretin)
MGGRVRKKIKFIIVWWLCGVALSGQAVWAEQTQLEIIPLKHLTVEQAIPLVEPFAGAEAVVTGMNNQLIVRATAANLAQIKQALAAFDVAAASLLISVKQDNGETSSDTSIDFSGRIESGDVTASVGDPAPGSDGAELRLRRTDAQADDTISQQIRVTEGYAAFIQIGQSVPVPGSSVGVSGDTVVVHDSIEFKDVTTGFSVLPRVNGDIVTLDISPQRERFNQADGSIDVQRVSTTVSGRLGEWIDIGAVTQSTSQRGSGILSSSSGASATQGRVLLKVDRLD